VDVGLALPQYDYAPPGAPPLAWETVSTWATAAERLGFASLWLADHLLLSVAKYGGSDRRYEGFEPLVTLGGLACLTTTVRLGILVACCQLRPPAVLAKQLAGLDVISGGRLVAGLGAGWFEPDFSAAGVAFHPIGRRMYELSEAVATVRQVWAGVEGAAPCLPPPVQRPGPPLWIGGWGDRLLAVAARHGDGWNTAWRWTPAAYRERLDQLDRACAAIGRDPATITRSVGLYTLVGEDEADLGSRFERLRALTPPGVLDGVSLKEWRAGRLVGSVEEVRDQLGRWEAMGVDDLIIGLGAVPFHSTTSDDLELVASAMHI